MNMRHGRQSEYLPHRERHASKGSVVTVPRLIPQDWRNQNITGTLVVVFTVDENGSVSNPTVVGSPSPELAALVLHAILQWKFQPALKDGTPVRVRAQQEFEFKLD